MLNTFVRPSVLEVLLMIIMVPLYCGTLKRYIYDEALFEFVPGEYDVTCSDVLLMISLLVLVPRLGIGSTLQS